MKLFILLVVLALTFALVDGRRYGLDEDEEEKEEMATYRRELAKQSELEHQEPHAHVKRKFIGKQANEAKNKKRGKTVLQNLEADDEESNITEEDYRPAERRNYRTNVKRKFVKANTNSKLNEKRRELIRLLKKWLQVKK